MKKTLWMLPLALTAACAWLEADPTPAQDAPPSPPPPPAAAIDWVQDPTAVTTWMRSLQNKPVASYEDGLRAAALLTDAELARQPWTTIKGRLMEKEIVPKEWNFLPASNLTKGQMAYLMVETLDIEGGVVLRVMPNTRRYAFRECQQNGLIVGNFSDEAVSGTDLLATLHKADLYKQEGSINSLRRP